MKKILFLYFIVSKSDWGN